MMDTPVHNTSNILRYCAFLPRAGDVSVRLPTHHLAQNGNIVDVLHTFLKAAAFDALTAELLNLRSRGLAERFIQRIAGLKLLTVDQQRAWAGICHRRIGCL